MYRAPSPFSGPPYSGPPYNSPETHYNTPYGPPQSPGGGPAITPGSITYTTSTGQDGQMIYHPFKAVPASYQTPTGVISGIQWVPAEATQVLPQGAQPASTDFAEAWNRGNLSREDQKALKEWQRTEEKRRRREEKESTKMLREKDRMSQARYEDADLRLARERDAVTRERRKSFSQSGGVGFPPSGSPNGFPAYAGSDRSGYGAGAGGPGGPMYPPPSPRGGGYTRERKYSNGGGLAEQFADLGIDNEAERVPPGGLARPRKYSTHENVAAERARRMSGNFGAERPSSMYSGGPAAGTYGAPRAYSATGGTNTYPSTSPYMNPSPGLRSVEPGYVSPHAPRPTSPYANPNYPPSPNQDPYARAASPYARAASPYARAASPYQRAASPFGQGVGPGDVYPPGHIMEGRPINAGGGARSRATTPLPGAMGQGVGFPTASAFPQPNIPHQMGHVAPPNSLAAPECFSRPINAAHPYTPFETMKIQDMDMFLEMTPRMPVVLQPHDIYPEDWTRLMEDIVLAWSGRLPVPSVPVNGKPPKRAALTAKLIELWNHSFFERRGIELVLYKGRERRSGALYGAIDLPLPAYDDSTDSVSSSSSSSDDDDDLPYGGTPYGVYGRNQGGTSDVMEARQRRKAEKKRRRKEKKAKRRAKAREKRYALYLTCLPQGGFGGTGAPPYGGPVGMGGMPGGLAGSHYSTTPIGPGYRSISPVPGTGYNPSATGGWA